MHNASCMKISTKENDNMQNVTSVGACYVAIAIILNGVFSSCHLEFVEVVLGCHQGWFKTEGITVMLFCHVVLLLQVIYDSCIRQVHSLCAYQLASHL